MKYLGTYSERKVYLINLEEDYKNELPFSNWVCFAIANQKPGNDVLSEFIRNSIKKDILEFKGFGIFGSFLDLQFDLEMVKMEVEEDHEYIDVMTTQFQGTDFSSAFYENFIGTCLPDRTDYKKVKIICVSFDSLDYSNLIIKNLERFKRNWIPLDSECKISMNDEKINIQLTKDEAIVLFELISRITEKNRSDFFEDHSEEKILWNIESLLQSKLAEPFSKEYKEIITKARKTVRES